MRKRNAKRKIKWLILSIANVAKQKTNSRNFYWNQKYKWQTCYGKCIKMRSFHFHEIFFFWTFYPFNIFLIFFSFLFFLSCFYAYVFACLFIVIPHYVYVHNYLFVRRTKQKKFSHFYRKMKLKNWNRKKRKKSKH